MNLPVPCIRIVFTAACLLLTGTAFAGEITADQVVSKCVDAMGGAEALADFETLSFTVVAPGRKPLAWEIERPNLVRKERDGELILVFDGRRAGFLMGPPSEDGTMPPPSIVPQEDWHHFEMDIALYIPAFLDHPTEYAGLTRAGESDAHVLRVDLPMGGRAVYIVDARSWMPVQVSLPGWSYDRCLGGFEKVGGITYPMKYWDCTKPSEISTLEELEINAPFDADRFRLPSTLE